ncbi:MAG TPA: hypothetical protein VFG75_10655 [Gaiella sp.]|nr:hypothetical protein [Gaiella sp.]
MTGVSANPTKVDDEHELKLEAAASLFDSAADELDLAGAHARRAAEHFRADEPARALSHAWAALGHLRTGEARLVAHAHEHRQPPSATDA